MSHLLRARRAADLFPVASLGPLSRHTFEPEAIGSGLAPANMVPSEAAGWRLHGAASRHRTGVHSPNPCLVLTLRTPVCSYFASWQCRLAPDETITVDMAIPSVDRIVLDLAAAVREAGAKHVFVGTDAPSTLSAVLKAAKSHPDLR